MQRITMFLNVLQNNIQMFSALETLLKLSISDNALNTGLSGEHLVRAEASNCCKDKTWSSFMCIMALSTVLKGSMDLWLSGLRRRTRDPTVVSSKPRSVISVKMTSQC